MFKLLEILNFLFFVFLSETKTYISQPWKKNYLFDFLFHHRVLFYLYLYNIINRLYILMFNKSLHW